MNCWPELRRLVSLQQSRWQRAERALLQTQRELQPLLRELSDFAEQEVSLRSLLASHQASDITLDYAQLLALLRHQALLRRQLDLLHLERDHVAGQCRQLEQSLLRQREHLREARRKHDSCVRSLQQRLRVQRLEQLRREERETEEMSGARR